MADSDQTDLTSLTVELLSAFVSNNTIDHGDLAALIQTTHSALATIDAPPPQEAPIPEFAPAVSVRSSLGSRDHIISLIDGKPYKTLKRHLRGHGLSPAEYRERYKLPADYPMIAPTYSQQRRDVAKRLGLGRKSSNAVAPESMVADEPAPRTAEATPSVASKRETPRDPVSKRSAAKGRVKKPTAAMGRLANAPTAEPVTPDVTAIRETAETAASASPRPKPKGKATTKRRAATKPAATKAKSATAARTKTDQKLSPAKRAKPKAEKTTPSMK